MSLPAPLAALLNEMVTQSPYVGQDAFGKPTYGPEVIRPARVEYQARVAANQAGQERTSNTTVFLDSDLPVTVRDRLVLPDGTAPAIQQINAPRDRLRPATISHYEVLL